MCIIKGLDNFELDIVVGSDFVEILCDEFEFVCGVFNEFE